MAHDTKGAQTGATLNNRPAFRTAATEAGPQGAEEARALAVVAARAATSKKGGDTVVLEVGPVLGIADAFVITSGSNHRQVATIAEEVEARAKAELGRKPIRTEGLADATWVLLDYGDVVVHVFHDEARRFYGLERLWADAPEIGWEEPTMALVE